MTAASSRIPSWFTSRSDRGSSTVELALLVPALVVVLGLLVAGGRLWFARTTVHEAAQTASRAASLARSSSQALSDGTQAGRASLATSGLRCADQAISVDTSAFEVPVGVPATVRATITCSVLFGDVLLPGMPGSIPLTGTGSSALDTYRSRQ
jgi:Flp pilus assembly protein TadG